jgi:hypothetical protein
VNVKYASLVDVDEEEGCAGDVRLEVARDIAVRIDAVSAFRWHVVKPQGIADGCGVCGRRLDDCGCGVECGLCDEGLYDGTRRRNIS